MACAAGARVTVPPPRPLYPVGRDRIPGRAAARQPDADADTPQYRYTAELAGEIERAWQQTWARLGTFNVPNPVGSLAPADGGPVPDDKMFVQDMFPYPSGEGLHVGHPLGYIATDVYARYFRMTGRNVLHALGFDSFGLPAEQYAVQTGTHPRTRTEANIVNFRRQLGRLGLGHDARRSFSTTDVEFYKWTQWIFLQIYNAWFDPATQQGPPDRRAGGRVRLRRTKSRRRPAVVGIVGGRARRCDRLVPVGVPGGFDGELVSRPGHRARQRGGHLRRPQRPRQLPGVPETVAAVDDAHHRVLGPAARRPRRAGLAGEGQDHAAQLDRPLHRRRRRCFIADDSDIEVFTTRPDTLFGATYLVLAPEHDLVDQLTAADWPDGRRPALDLRRGHPGRGRRRLPRARSRPSPTWNARRARPRPACSSARMRPIRPTDNGSRSSSPTTCWPATAPARSWRCPGTTSATGSSPTSSACRSWRSLPAAIFRRPPTPATATLVNSDYLDGLSVASAKEAITARLDGRRPRAGPHRVQAAGLAVRPPAVLG